MGHGSRELLMLKFRKMHADATGIALTTAGDARLTRIGAFLAKSKLDEIPQLWHVLRGEMSLVGPRPETHAFVERHRDEYEEILSVRPGLVGLSQIAFVAEGSILDAEDPADPLRQHDPSAEGHAGRHVRTPAHAAPRPEDPGVVTGRRAPAPSRSR